MKKFKFRFQAVERVRKIEMELQAKDLALANQRVNELQQEKEGLEFKLRSERDRLRERTLSEAWGERLVETSRAYQKDLESRIRAKMDEIVEAKQQVVKERKELIERQKKKTAIDKLKEREQERYYEEQRRQETKMLDEVSTTRFKSSRD